MHQQDHRAADRMSHLAIRLDAMLQAVELPAGIAHLDTCLPDVDGDNLTHGFKSTGWMMGLGNDRNEDLRPDR